MISVKAAILTAKEVKDLEKKGYSKQDFRGFVLFSKGDDKVLNVAKKVKAVVKKEVVSDAIHKDEGQGDSKEVKTVGTKRNN